MRDTFDLRRGTPSKADMELINRISEFPLAADQVYIFGIRLCDNEVDCDFERFTRETLEQLARMYVGKAGIIKDSQKIGRIYQTELVVSPTKETKAGDPYCWIKAYAYIVKSCDTKELISSLRNGTQNDVSVGCSVETCSCSICGEGIAYCEHELGKVYDGRLCFANLEDAKDVYEWSFTIKPKKCKEDKPPVYSVNLIDPVDVKQAVVSGLLEVKVNNGNILLGSQKSGEWVKIGEV